MTQWNDLPFYYDRVTGRIFHATSIQGLKAIIQSGEIRANRGERSYTFVQSAISYATKMGYVSLFDFFHCSEEKIRVMAVQWPRVIARHDPAILLLLDRLKVSSRLITSAAAALDSGGQFMKTNYHIPRVEAWYPDRIPLAFCERALKVEWSQSRIDEITLF